MEYIYPDEEERRQVDYSEANLVSSLTEDGLHAPVIDIDWPAVLDERHLEILVPSDEVWIMPQSELDDAVGVLHKTGFVSQCSLVEEGKTTRVRFELLGPARLVGSRTPEHFHLYVDTEYQWAAYDEILIALCMLGVVEGGFQWASHHREMSFLRIAQPLGQMTLIAAEQAPES